MKKKLGGRRLFFEKNLGAKTFLLKNLKIQHFTFQKNPNSFAQATNVIRSPVCITPSSCHTSADDTDDDFREKRETKE